MRFKEQLVSHVRFTPDWTKPREASISDIALFYQYILIILSCNKDEITARPDLYFTNPIKCDEKRNQIEILRKHTMAHMSPISKLFKSCIINILDIAIVVCFRTLIAIFRKIL